MARTITQIHNGMLTDIASNEVLSAYLTSNSLYAIFRLFTFILAFAISIFEGYLDQHFFEVDDKIANQRYGTEPWYRDMALRFQYGFTLVQDKDYFINEGFTDEEIAASKIIKYAAVNESEDESRLIVKIAGEVGGELSDFEDLDQVAAIENFFKRIKIAGTNITIINYKADQLYLNMQIKRDALILNSEGMSILNANYPVNEALKEFMKELKFNGELRLSALVDKIQLIPGVLDATLLSAESSWIDPELDGYGIPQPIFISKIAESGYFKIVTFDNIAYVV